MTSARRADLVAALVAGFTLAVFVPKVRWPESAVYHGLLGAQALIDYASVAKLVFLLLAAAFALANARRLEAGNPARRPWATFGAGLLLFLAGQSILGFSVLVLRQPSPFPSLGDAFFVAGYPVLVFALFDFVRAYRDAGLAVGSPAEHAAIAVAGAAAFTVLDLLLVGPILSSPAPPLERLLNVAYPTLDFALLVPILILIRITSRFHGGRAAFIWGFLVAGGVFLCTADIAYAYLSTTGRAWLDPLTDACYVLAYVLLARGTRAQHELLTSP